MSGVVRVRENGYEHNTGAARAEAKGLDVLDEPTHNPDGSQRRATRVGGRPVKPKTTVAEAAERKSDAKPAAGKQAAVIESAPTTEENR